MKKLVNFSRNVYLATSCKTSVASGRVSIGHNQYGCYARPIRLLDGGRYPRGRPQRLGLGYEHDARAGVPTSKSAVASV
jgi:hypothetical protein